MTALTFAIGVVAACAPGMALANLPDNRIYEQVSPANKDGSELGATFGARMASEGGNSVMYTATGPIGASNNGGGTNQEFISRHVPRVGWVSEPADPRHQGLVGYGQSPTYPSFYAGAEEFRHVYLDSAGCCTGGRAAYSPEEPESGIDLKLYSSENPFEVATWIGKPQNEHPLPPLGGWSPRFTLPWSMVAGVSPEGSTLYFSYSGTLLPEDEEPRIKETNSKGEPVLNAKGEQIVLAGRSSFVGECCEGGPGTGWGAAGFYEWNNNKLSEAGVLPTGNLSAHGAIAAAEVNDGLYRDGVHPEELDGQVSENGKRVFFVSPDPQGGAPSSEPPELYMREALANGEHKTVLISRDPLFAKVKEKTAKGAEEEFPARAPGGVLSFANASGQETGGSTYAWASPDGSRVFFASPAALSKGVAAKSEWSFYLASFTGGKFKLEVTTESGTQTTAPMKWEATAAEVQAALEALSSVGAGHVMVSGGPNEYSVTFPDLNTGFELNTAELLLSPNTNGSESVTNRSPSKMYEYDVETGEVTYLPENEGQFAASSTDGSTVMFVRPAKYGPPPVSTLERPAELALMTLGRDGPEITSIAAEVTSVTPARAAGNGSAFLFYASGDAGPLAKFNNGGYGQFYHYDVSSKDLECVSCPPGGVIATGPAETNYDIEWYYEFKSVKPIRMMSEDGTRVFFQSPDALLGADINGEPDVYEWENGHLYLISGGNAVTPSYYIDNSRTGGDVFFFTAQGLIPSDGDEQVDVYDARIPRPGDSPPVTETPCSGEVCQGPPSVPKLLSPAASATFEGLGDIPPEVLTPEKETTRAVKCKKGYVKKNGKCVKQAKKKKHKPKGKRSVAGKRRGK